MSSLDDFLLSLSEEQKQALLKALITTNIGHGPEQTTKAPDNKEIKQFTTVKSVTVDENFKVNKTDTITSSRRKEPVRGRENRWQDEGEFRDVETPNFERTPRRRPSAKKVDLECHVCGKIFKEDSRYVYGEFPRCNRCTGK